MFFFSPMHACLHLHDMPRQVTSNYLLYQEPIFLSCHACCCQLASQPRTCSIIVSKRCISSKKAKNKCVPIKIARCRIESEWTFSQRNASCKYHFWPENDFSSFGKGIFPLSFVWLRKEKSRLNIDKPFLNLWFKDIGYLWWCQTQDLTHLV